MPAADWASAVEERGDGVLLGRAQRIDRRAANEALVHAAAVAQAGEVAPRLGEPLQERVFDATFPQTLSQFDRPRGVAQDLDRLDSCEIGEVPAATRRDQQPMALHLEQPQRVGALGGRERRHAVRVEERVGGRRIDDDVDVRVARHPRIAKKSCRRGLRRLRQDGAPSSSTARRSGARHDWFHPGWLYVVQPQSDRHRSTPCAQLHAVAGTISASSVGACVSSHSA